MLGILLLCGLGSAAAAQSSVERLLDAARARVLEHTVFQADSLAVEFSRVDPAGLPEDCVFELGPAGTGARGALPVCVRMDDRIIRRFSLGWKLRSWHRVPVARRELERNEILAADMLCLSLRETTKIDSGDIVDCETLLGQRLKRRTAAGSAILEHQVLPVPDVFRNQQLTLWYRGDGIELRVPARVERSARVGEMVPVRLEDSGKRLQALLLSPGLAVLEMNP
ncbi:MAG: flagellar basal body P-ring formation protein FlgA [Candidatus Cloacimonetes bacterium]|nr:flagellar basal body P-ring formation protein FlgA [Candidatus Cloacimonadota bacterium]